jgi:hypothetical protein
MRTFHRTWRTLVALALALGLCAVLAPGGVSAHERRDLVGGKYQAVVGWLVEPAYDHQLNGLDLTVVDKTQKGDDGKDKPVEDLDKTLKAEILFGGGRKMDLPVQRRPGFPGKYTAPIVPTRPGQYTFHLFGTIEGNPIDEKFDSGPGRFDDVTSLAAVQFPPDQPAATQPAPAPPATQPAAPPATAAPQATSQPTAPQPVAQQAPPAQPAPQPAALPADYQARLDAARGDAADARSQAQGARTLGLAGLAVGLLGLTAAVLALLRRPAQPVTSDE